jgi:hypothetical protein
MSPDSLSTRRVDEVRTKWKKESTGFAGGFLSESVSKAMEAWKLLSNKKASVKLINTKTNEVTVHNSIGDAARYLQQLDPLYKKAQPGALTGNAKRGSRYKGVFLVQYIDDKEG